jgi:hypothetical protein
VAVLLLKCRLPEALNKIIISISIFWITDSIDLTNVKWEKELDMWQVN